MSSELAAATGEGFAARTAKRRCAVLGRGGRRGACILQFLAFPNQQCYTCSPHSRIKKVAKCTIAARMMDNKTTKSPIGQDNGF
eukprot:2415723-Prymnesium_polylepis.1